MKRLVLIVVLICLILTLSSVPRATDEPRDIPPSSVDEVDDVLSVVPTDDMDDLLSSVGRTFLENIGQMEDDEVLFYAQGDPLCVGFKRDRLVFMLMEESGTDGIAQSVSNREREAVVFHLVFEGSDQLGPTARAPVNGPTHIYVGNDPSRWVRGARSFREVVYEDLWDRIDLRFHFTEERLKYEFIVREGGDPKSITCRYEGIEGLSIDPTEGDLLIDTGMGVISDSAPVITSDDDGLGRSSAGYKLKDEQTYKIEVDGQVEGIRPLVIDPGLRFATYFGGSEDDAGGAIFLSNGSICVSGSTSSNDLPRASGRYVVNSNTNGFFSILKADMSEVLCTLIIGGSEDDNLVVKELADGRLLLLGETHSNDLPVTNDASRDYMQGPTDAFLGLVRKADLNLTYCTYFGGNRYDSCLDIIARADGGYTVVGTTNSSYLPMQTGAYCSDYVETSLPRYKHRDSVFLCKFDKTFRNITYLTYLNGVNNTIMSVGHDTIVSVCNDTAGNIYIVGSTNYSLMETTPGVYCETFSGHDDVFIAKFDPNGTELIACMYMGDHATEQAYTCAYVNGTIVIGGLAQCPHYDVTLDAYQRTFPSINYHGFLSIFDEDLTTLRYSTFFGGNGRDYISGITPLPHHNRYLLKVTTYSTDLPCTPGCYYSKNLYANLYSGILDIEQNEIVYGTYLSTQSHGQYYAWIYGHSLSDTGEFIGVLSTQSEEQYTTEGAYQKAPAGGYDIWLSQVDPRPCDPPGPPRSFVAEDGVSSVTLGWEPPPFNGARIDLYTITRKCQEDGKEVEFQVDGDILNFTDENVVDGHHYRYWVNASIYRIGGEPSDELTTWPLGMPSEPGDPMVQTGDGNVTLTWSPPSYAGGGTVRGFYLERGQSLSNMEVIGGGPLSAESSRFLDWNVTIGEEYFYRIRAFNEKHNGTTSIPMRIIAMRPPGTPEYLNLVEGDSEVLLRWSKPQSDGGASILGYNIYRGTSEDDLKFSSSTEWDKLEQRVPSLKNGWEYFFMVTAYTDVGEGRPTEVLSAVPYGVPQEPTNFTAEGGDRTVKLTWDSPRDDGGREVWGYNIYSKGPFDADFKRIITNISGEGFVVLDLENGQEYFFEVAAMNLRGEGIRSATRSAVPMTSPSEPWGLNTTSVPTGIQLQWSSPNVTGGATTMSYIVLKGTNPSILDRLVNTTTQEIFVDTRTSAGVRYYYRIIASNLAGESTASDMDSHVRKFISSPPIIETISDGDRFVEIKWSPPQDDGGSDVLYYSIYRRSGAEELAVYKDRLLVTNFTDTDVVYRRTYVYTVRAWNGVGWSMHSDEVQGTPRQRPDRVTAFDIKMKDDHVYLRWAHPSSGGRVPVTEYILLKGSTPYNTVAFMTVGNDRTDFNDYNIESGVTYYYSIQANSELGPGEMYDPQLIEVEEVISPGPTSLHYLLLTLLIVMVGITVVLVRRRRATKPDEEAMTDMYEEDMARKMEAAISIGKDVPPALGTTTAATNAEDTIQAYIIEEVLVVYRDGRLITSCAREERGTKDADLMSGMLIAVQGLIQDGLEGGGTLESIKYGDNLISLATGNHLLVAAVVFGVPDETFGVVLQDKALEIENAYTGIVEDWTGEPSAFLGLGERIQPLIDRTSYLTRENVGAVTHERTVSLLSAIDFQHGYVRLKLASVNSTDETITDAAIEVHYDSDMLQLESVVPESISVHGDRVNVGNLKPGARKTVALLFDPQICQGTHIDGHLSYYDTTGELKYVEMKRRFATVVCPVFFTAKNANKAMLRRLVKEKLHATDLRVYRYPRSLPPYEVLLIAKSALGEDVQLVREYIARGPPYEAEVWYYAQTKAKGYEFVIRIGVMEDKGVLEVFAASTAMEPITGLLAEFRRELNVAYAEGRMGDARIEVERDEQVRRDLATRPLRLDLPDEDEVLAEDIAEA